MLRRITLGVVGLVLAANLAVAGLGIANAKVAAVDVLPTGCTADICKDKSSGNPLYGPSGVMTKIIHLLAIFVGLVAIFSLIISGLMMITAGGDASKVSNARRAFAYALIGLVVAALAQTIVAFVLTKIAP
ncbi:MAG TPA: hypothetical protein VLG11_06310 [Candidatus Saccharimonadales bacterium]|nr:hypothetical protein [Candidatus Saccharimonadales bacterium]